MPQIVATFSHYGLAHAVFEQLRQFGIPLHYHNIISLEHGNDINNDRFFHLLQQGSCLLNFEVQEEDFIFVYEVICSFGGTFEIFTQRGVTANVSNSRRIIRAKYKESVQRKASQQFTQ